MSHTSSVALKNRSGISRPLPCVTRERAASVGGSPRWAITSVLGGAAALGAPPGEVWPGAVPGAQPTSTNTIDRYNRVAALILRTFSSAGCSAPVYRARISLERQLLPDALLLRLFEDIRRGRGVLGADALALEEGDAVLFRAAAHLATDHLVQLHRLLPTEAPALERPEQVAALHFRLLKVVDDDRVAAAHGGLVDLAARPRVAARRVHVHAWLQQIAGEHGFTRIRDRDDDVRSTQALLRAADRNDLGLELVFHLPRESF